MKKQILLVLFLLFLPAICSAGDSDQVLEKKKAAIVKVMNQGNFKAYIQNDKKFCATFLVDFKEQKNIEHIKPILEVDSYNDPELQAYFKQCPNKKFNEKIMMSARAAEEIEKKEELLGRKLTEEELAKEINFPGYYATKNFKLFKVNLDNDMKNGNEFVFYAEGYRLAIPRQFTAEYTYGGYRIIDLKTCKIITGVSTNDPFDYEKQQPLENYNGIIKYKGEYYVFDLYKRQTHKVYRLVLEKYNKKRKNINSVCEYRLHE
jgi:hypothetical protein